jgi:hypothetical protein
MVAIANLILLIWFIVTLNRIQRNTREIAEYARQLAICHPPSKDQARVINRDLTVIEILAALADRGVRVTLSDRPGPPELVVSESGGAHPELLRQLGEHRAEVIELLRRKERRARAEPGGAPDRRGM